MSAPETAPPLAMFGRVQKSAVLARFGRLVADERCTCVECFDAGCEGPPVLAPAGVEVGSDPATGAERAVSMGIWLHGARLREHEIARGRFNEAMAAVVARLKAPGGHE